MCYETGQIMCSQQVGDLTARLFRRVDDAGGYAVFGAMSVAGGEAWTGCEEQRALRAVHALAIPKREDHLFGTEQVEDEGHAVEESRVRRTLRPEQLRHSPRRRVAEGVGVKVGERGDDEPAAQFEDRTVEVVGENVGESVNPPCFDHNHPLMDGFVGRVGDHGPRKGEILGNQSQGEGEEGQDRLCERLHNLASLIGFRSCGNVSDGARVRLEATTRLARRVHVLHSSRLTMPTLAQTLKRIREAGAARRDPAVTTLLRRGTADLKASGILNGAVQAGDHAPLFARPNLRHDTVRLGRVLRSGPAVVSFFRGRW